MLWLGVIGKGIYQNYMGHLMRPTPNWPVAIIFYLLYIIGLVIFAIYPAIANKSWTYALWYGAMFEDHPIDNGFSGHILGKDRT